MIENINCQTKEIGMDNIIWRNGTRKGKGGKYQYGTQEISEQGSYDLYI